jgi:hypothetical protein
MIIIGKQVRKDVLRSGMTIDEIDILSDNIKFNDYGYAIVNGRLYRDKGNGKNEIEGSNIKGIIDKKGNEIFPFKSYGESKDEISSLTIAGCNVISKEGLDENGNPIYKHTKIVDNKIKVTNENQIIASPLSCNHYQFLNNHTLLATILYNLNTNGKVPIYYAKKFLYSMLYRGGVVSEFYNDIKPLKYDDHANILKANAMFYALEPTEDCFLTFYLEGSFVTGEYPVTCSIDDRGNALPPFSCKLPNKNISIESVKQDNPNFDLEIVRQKVLKQILEYELAEKRVSLNTLLEGELTKYSLGTLKQLLMMIPKDIELNPNNDALSYINENMINSEIERRNALIKKQYPNL